MVAKALRLYLFSLGGLWAVALGAVALQGGLLHHSYPHNTIFLPPDIRFSDFTIFDGRFRLWSRSTTAFFDVPGFPFPYPAPTLAVFLVLWNFTPSALLCYLSAIVVFAFAATVCLSARYPSLRIPVAATFLGSFPLFFLLDRANIEGAVWIATALGVLAFAKRWLRFAEIFLGLAAAMKLFPALLLLLFIGRKNYRSFVFSIAYAVVFTFASLAAAGPSIPLVFGRLAVGLDFFRETVILEYANYLAGFEHSAFSLVKQMLHVFVRGEHLHSLISAVYLPYLAVAIAAFAALYWLRIRQLPTLNQLFALVILSVTLPFVSFDYPLVHVYIPWAAFLIVLSVDVTSGRLPLTFGKILSFLLPCAVVFAPLSWMLVGNVGFGAQVKTLALFALLLAALRTPLPSTLFGEVKIPGKAMRNLVLPLEQVSEFGAKTLS